MKLYKFKDINEKNLAALEAKQLWFSNQSDFNDPFEGVYTKDNQIPQSTLTKLVTLLKQSTNEKKQREIFKKVGLQYNKATSYQLVQKLAEHDLQKLIDIIHSSKILCLSLYEEQNDPVYSNLMWSHYADGLRGFCLVFDGDLLQKDIYISSNRTMRPIRIKYQDTPDILFLKDFINSETLLGNDTDINFLENVIKTIATKSKDWAYENEFRILTLSDRKNHCYSENTLKEIIIGEKMTKEARGSLLNKVQTLHPGIIVKEARLKSDSYALEIITM